MTTLSLNIDARGAQKGAKDFKRATDQVKTSAMQADSRWVQALLELVEDYQVDKHSYSKTLQTS